MTVLIAVGTKHWWTAQNSLSNWLALPTCSASACICGENPTRLNWCELCGLQITSQPDDSQLQFMRDISVRGKWSWLRTGRKCRVWKIFEPLVAYVRIASALDCSHVKSTVHLISLCVCACVQLASTAAERRCRRSRRDLTCFYSLSRRTNTEMQIHLTMRRTSVAVTRRPFFLPSLFVCVCTFCIWHALAHSFRNICNAMTTCNGCPLSTKHIMNISLSFASAVGHSKCELCRWVRLYICVCVCFVEKLTHMCAQVHWPRRARFHGTPSTAHRVCVCCESVSAKSYIDTAWMGGGGRG